MDRSPIITSLLDTDLYKITMAQAVYHAWPAAQVKYKFKCRTKGVDLRPLKPFIDEQLDQLCSLKLRNEEIEWLRAIRFIKPAFADLMSIMRLDRSGVQTIVGADQLEIVVQGSWLHRIFFEVPVLAIVSEVYFRSLIGSDTDMQRYEDAAVDRLKEKLEPVKRYIATEHEKKPFRLQEFGTRRRFSRRLQERLLQVLANEIPECLFGTSNVDMARRHNLRPLGTMAHEWLQAHQALGPRLVDSQKAALETWVQEYRGDLGYALTDCIGLEPFCRDFDLFYAKLFDGVRHDSGDEYKWSERMLAHFESLGIDPKTKYGIYSNNLNFVKALDLCRTFEGRWKTSFGIGTFITNDVPGFKALNNVMKMTECNGQSVAKLSDEPGKTMCEDDGYLAYLKQVFRVAA